MTRGQAIRPSQFVYTFGVGAIIETPEGPGVVRGFADWDRIFNERNADILLERYEITDPRIQSALGTNGSDVQVFSLPTNASLEKPDSTVLFRLRRFPTWALCVTHDYLYRMVGEDASHCPDCGPSKSDDQRRAIRFIQVCETGHMSDIDWSHVVHKNAVCDNTLYKWDQSRGNTIEDIRLVCETCHREALLSDIYTTNLVCPGDFQEHVGQGRACLEPARAILRNASNVRVAQVSSFLTIPPEDQRLVLLLSTPSMKAALSMLANMMPNWTTQDAIARLEAVQVKTGSLGNVVITELKRAEATELEIAIKVVLDPPRRPSDLSDAKLQEFDVLKRAVIHGHQSDYLYVRTDSMVKVRAGRFIELRVTPVDVLRVVSVQEGYRRLQSRASALVPIYYQGRTSRWLLGVEGHGEGVFVDTERPSDLLAKLDSDISRKWSSERSSTGEPEFDPLFVWWHTLSHRIITALGVDSGYSSSAIRECVYLKEDPVPDGGILLYATQRGGDGTLGGLVSLVPDFRDVIGSAINSIDSCSNDPLCEADEFSSGRFNGSACYGCLLVSETSCGYMNRFLDRNILRQSL